ncbi:MAG: BatA and WFA domain-containing protein [Pirellulales bacterium]|nr:BatA and WFA domain-containing protein [Pirellulales bacterium]
MWPTWINMLSWWQWAILLAVPPAITLLYFLKLRRRPVEVPSTYLWSRTVEDLHVNSIWQRLRRNLLLFLQLLLLLLIIVALLRPAWRGQKLIGHRFVFLIDNSASMRASDVEPNRLEQAKLQASALVDNMISGDVGMVISFADTARVEQMFTGDRSALRRAIESIEPTDRPTSLIEALKVASAQTNARQRTSENNEQNTEPAETLPATAYILSDGRFEQVTESSLGALTPIYIPIGTPSPANVAILAFTVRQDENQDRRQAFARLKNFGTKKSRVEATLRLNGNLYDADRVSIGPGEVQGIVFDVGQIDSGVLELEIETHDCLDADNRAWAVVNMPQPADVLLVSPGNHPLELALGTERASKLAHVVVEPPSVLETPEYETAALGGAYDLIIYDRCRPATMPQANTLFFGRVPPVEGWSLGKPVEAPQIIDIDPNHPMMQWLAMDDVLIGEGRPIGVGPGGDILVDSDAGPLLAIAPREAFQDAAVGFVLVEQQEEKSEGRTTWFIRPSFPMFVLNTLAYLGHHVQASGEQTVRPGRPIMLDIAADNRSVLVAQPDGRTVRPTATRTGQSSFSATDQLGIYEVRANGECVSRFAVNLFDSNESDLPPRQKLDVGFEEIAGQAGWEAARREIWRPLLLLGLFVLIVEWYIFNQRVSM